MRRDVGRVEAAVRDEALEHGDEVGHEGREDRERRGGERLRGRGGAGRLRDGRHVLVGVVVVVLLLADGAEASGVRSIRALGRRRLLAAGERGGLAGQPLEDGGDVVLDAVAVAEELVPLVGGVGADDGRARGLVGAPRGLRLHHVLPRPRAHALVDAAEEVELRVHLPQRRAQADVAEEAVDVLAAARLHADLGHGGVDGDVVEDGGDGEDDLRAEPRGGLRRARALVEGPRRRRGSRGRSSGRDGRRGV